MNKKTYIIILFTFFLLILPVSAHPGEIIWQQTLGGPAEEWGYSLDSTADGGIISVGITHSLDASGTDEQRNGDLWVNRLDKNGNLLWDRAFGGSETDYGLSVRTISDDGFIIVGTTGSNNGNISGYYGNGDLMVLRLSSSGNPLWHKVYGGNQTDEGGDILQTPDGGFILTGYTVSDDGDVSGHHGGGDLWIVRLDSSGTIVWQKTYGGSGRDSGSSIIRTSDGGYALTGNTYSSDGDITKNQGSSDLWVLKTDDLGNLLWNKTYGGSKLDWGHSLIELSGGDLLVAGVTVSSDGDVSINKGVGDIWVLKLTPAGEKIWEKTYGGSFSDNVWNAEPSPSGGAYLVGETFSVDGDFIQSQGDSDLVIFEIDGNGTMVWNLTLGGSQYESGSWVKLLTDGNLVVSGITQSPDGDVSGYTDGGDLWIVKVNASIESEQPIVEIPAENVKIVMDVSANQTPSLPPTSQPSSSALLPPLPGLSVPPQDLNGDRRYEDLNGNGALDLQDPAVFFSNYEWIVANYPSLACDFNGNGGIDFGDISALFSEVSGL
jgi:hypothetical protein